MDRVHGRALLAAIVAALAGCATPPPPAPPATPAAKSQPAETARPSESERPRPGASAKRAPIPTRALNIAADCSFRDDTGYSGRMKLKVADARVEQFEAAVEVPRRGACRFELAAFRQTATTPNVVLAANGSRCTVRMWEQGRRVTVAFTDCQARCTGDAHDYLWPILASSNGTCG